MSRLVQEFKEFLRQFKVVGGAVAFIIALTVTKVVSSLVNDVVLPLLNIAFPQERFSQMVWQIDSSAIRIGSFASVLIEFVIILAIIFIFVRYVLKWETEQRKK